MSVTVLFKKVDLHLMSTLYGFNEMSSVYSDLLNNSAANLINSWIFFSGNIFFSPTQMKKSPPKPHFSPNK